MSCELELGVFTETGGIEVAEGTSVTEGLNSEFGGGDLRGEFGTFTWIGDAGFSEGLDRETSGLGFATA